MKRTLLLLLILSINISAFAQNIRIGIKGGLNLSNFSYYYPGVTRPSDIKFGYHIGGLVNFGFKRFDIQPGLIYTSVGDQYDFQFLFSSGPNTTYNFKQIINYIQLPVNFLYHTASTHGNSLHIGGGPYFAYGTTAKLTSGSNSTEIKLGDPDKDHLITYNRTDYGFNFIAGGLIKNKIIVDMGYGLGLGNLVSGNSRQNNRVINFSVGYLFK
jgi:hypothetical protein